MASVTTDQRLGVNASQAIKVPCRVCATSNITLSGEQTIDGVAVVTDDRVLLTGQTTASENGIYIVDTGTWSRAPDWDGTADIVTGTVVRVFSGSSNAGYWAVTTTGTITIGTTNVVIASTEAISAINSPYIYVSKADAILNTPVNGKAYYIGGTDGGWFYGVTGGSGYADDGGNYCGTQFIPTGGDGSSAWVRNGWAVYNGQVPFSVKWFGAAVDGSADDTSAWNTAQTALLAINSYGGEVTMPPGISTVSSITPKSYITFVGAGGLNSIIKGDTSSAHMIYDVTNNIRGFGMRNIGVDASQKPDGYGGVYISSKNNLSNFDTVTFIGNGFTSGKTMSKLFYFNGQRTATPDMFPHTSVTGAGRWIDMKNILCYDAGGDGLYFDQAVGYRLENVISSRCGESAMRMEGCSEMHITNYLSWNAKHNYYQKGGSWFNCSNFRLDLASQNSMYFYIDQSTANYQSIQGCRFDHINILGASYDSGEALFGSYSAILVDAEDAAATRYFEENSFTNIGIRPAVLGSYTTRHLYGVEYSSVANSRGVGRYNKWDIIDHAGYLTGRNSPSSPTATITVDGGGAITGATIIGGGKYFKVGDIVNASDPGSSATNGYLKVATVDTIANDSAILTLTVYVAGSGYTAGTSTLGANFNASFPHRKRVPATDFFYVRDIATRKIGTFTVSSGSTSNQTAHAINQDLIPKNKHLSVTPIEPVLSGGSHTGWYGIIVTNFVNIGVYVGASLSADADFRWCVDMDDGHTNVQEDTDA